MKRIKSFVASTLIVLIMFARTGFGVMAVDYAIVLGGAFALALRMTGPSLIAQAKRRAEEMRDVATS